jgi:hypothetical protein
MNLNQIDPFLAAHFRYWKQRVTIRAKQHKQFIKGGMGAPFSSDFRESMEKELEFFAYPTVRKIRYNMQHRIDSLSLQNQMIAVAKDPAIFQKWKNNLPGDQGVKSATTLDEALAKCRANYKIFLLTSENTLKNPGFVGNLSICGDPAPATHSVITGDGDKYCLLAIAGNTELDNFVISCTNELVGILITSGRVAIRNCIFRTPDPIDGLLILGGTTVTLENCLICCCKNGIVVEKGAKLTLKNCQIKFCEIDIKILGQCEVKIENSLISHCEEHAIVQFTKTAAGSEEKFLITEKLLEEPEKLIGVILAGNCKFERNKDGDLCTFIS